MRHREGAYEVVAQTSKILTTKIGFNDISFRRAIFPETSK